MQDGAKNTQNMKNLKQKIHHVSNKKRIRQDGLKKTQSIKNLHRMTRPASDLIIQHGARDTESKASEAEETSGMKKGNLQHRIHHTSNKQKAV